MKQREKRTESLDGVRAGKRARPSPQDAIGEVVDLALLEHEARSSSTRNTLAVLEALTARRRKRKRRDLEPDWRAP